MKSLTVATVNMFKGMSHDRARVGFSRVLDHRPDVGVCQEWVSGRNDILARAKGYVFARADEGGGPVFWRTDRFDSLPVSVRAVRLSRAEFVGNLPGRKSRLPANFATRVQLADLHGDPDTVVYDAHLDAEVQVEGRYRTDLAHRLRVGRHKRQVRRLGRHVARDVRRGLTVIVGLDGNFDGLELAPLKSCWKGQPAAKGGTLGKRRVDIVFAPWPAAKVTTIDTGSDHRAVIATY